MHHPYSYFAHHDGLRPECLLGTTLRHPASLFESCFWWCHDKQCPRPGQPKISCGFLCCDKGSHVDKVYSSHRGTYKTFLENPEEWSIGRNTQTRFLSPTHGNTIAQVPAVVNSTRAGRAMVAEAKAHLDRFDFVLMYETLAESYKNILGIPLPTTKYRSSDRIGNGTRPSLTESEGRRVVDLNQLDLELWEYGMQANKRQVEARHNLRENTRVVAVKVKGSPGKRCLEVAGR